MMRGVWVGEVARILSVGFLGVADQTMGITLDNVAFEGKADYLMRKRKEAYLALVCRYMAREGARRLAFPLSYIHHTVIQ